MGAATAGSSGTWDMIGRWCLSVRYRFISPVSFTVGLRRRVGFKTCREQGLRCSRKS